MTDYDPDTRPTISCPNPKCGHSIIIPPLLSEMGDRHPKWKRVEPGTVIPAGQPFRIEYPDAPFDPIDHQGARADWVMRDFGPASDWFVDSSWVPPLVLPTEPTWGIAVRSYGGMRYAAPWALGDDDYMRGGQYIWHKDNVLDFIPLTDEQVKRIEAAR